MGVYTYVEQTLGLKTNPFLVKMKESLESGETPEQKDWMTLLNAAARYETVKHRIRNEGIKFEDLDEDQSYEANEQLKHLITEMDSVYFSYVNQQKEYVMPFDSPKYASKERLSYKELMDSLDRHFLVVKERQQDFDLNNDNYKVVGALQYLKRDYGITYSITADQDIEHVKKEVKEAVKAVLVKEMRDKQRFLDELND